MSELVATEYIACLRETCSSKPGWKTRLELTEEEARGTLAEIDVLLARVRELEAQIAKSSTCACCKADLMDPETEPLCDDCAPSFERFEDGVGCFAHPYGRLT